MNICPNCNAPMSPCFTGMFCSKECDLKPAITSNVNPIKANYFFYVNISNSGNLNITRNQKFAMLTANNVTSILRAEVQSGINGAQWAFTGFKEIKHSRAAWRPSDFLPDVHLGLSPWRKES